MKISKIGLVVAAVICLLSLGAQARVYNPSTIGSLQDDLNDTSVFSGTFAHVVLEPGIYDLPQTYIPDRFTNGALVEGADMMDATTIYYDYDPWLSSNNMFSSNVPLAVKTLTMVGSSGGIVADCGIWGRNITARHLIVRNCGSGIYIDGGPFSVGNGDIDSCNFLNNNTGAGCIETEILVQHSQFENCSTDVNIGLNSRADIIGCNFFRPSIPLHRHIYFVGSGGRVINCQLNGQAGQGIGIALDDYGFTGWLGPIRIANNLITDLRDGIWLDGGDPMSVTGHYVAQVQIINNDFINNQHGIWCSAESTDWLGGLCILGMAPDSVENNIFYSSDDSTMIAIGTEYGTVMDLFLTDGHPGYNHYAVDLNTWPIRDTSQLGPGNTYGDPLLYDDSHVPPYALQYGSPCINGGNPDPVYNDIDGSRNDIGCYGGPYGDWDYSIPLQVASEILYPQRFNLYVYPNPFNSATVIRCDGPGARLEIYDISGRCIRQAETNNGIFRWDGTDDEGIPVASGIYYVRVVSDNRTLARPLVLLK